MSPSTILFVITLIALVFFVFSARKASRRSEEKIDALEAKLAAAEGDGRPANAGGSAGTGGASTSAAGAGAPGAYGDALHRISGYLRHAVAAPIQEGLASGDEELRVRADEALAAVEDMEFFVDDRELDLRPHGLQARLQEVADEYTEEFDVIVKFRDTNSTLRANISPEAFKDAVYLVLVNAGRFGRGNPIEVSLEADGEQASIRIRDHGEGFSEEALRRGTEAFYTTEEGALGMGLTHAARILREHDGEMRLGNSPRGGAEVEIRLPKV